MPDDDFQICLVYVLKKTKKLGGCPLIFEGVLLLVHPFGPIPMTESSAPFL